MAIEFKNVSFSYPNGYVANENLNLMIQEGERVAIVGQNGAGKTTAVKLLNGLHKPSEGDVFVDGVDTKTKTTAQIAKCVGYVFQNPDDQIFKYNVGCQISGYLTVVICGQYLHQVKSHKIQVLDFSYQIQGFQGSKASHLRGACSGRISGIYGINVKGQEAGLIPHALQNRLNQGL